MTNKPTLREILIVKAKEDLSSAKILFNSGDYSEEIIMFHCQQAIEKMLKAFLDFKGLVYPKTHDLEALLSLCLNNDASFKQIDFVTELTPYAVEARYDAFSPASGIDVAATLKKVSDTIVFIEAKFI